MFSTHLQASPLALFGSHVSKLSPTNALIWTLKIDFFNRVISVISFALKETTLTISVSTGEPASNIPESEIVKWERYLKIGYFFNTVNS